MQNTKTELSAQNTRTTLTDKINDLEGISGLYLFDRIEGLGMYQQTKRQISSIFFSYLLDEDKDPTEATKFDVWALHNSFQAIIDRLYSERQDSILAPVREMLGR
ncbi:MAG TPA: hypothetical protein DCM71_12335 [Runella sp.]|nr:hypothetical protein [Runella sp.]